MAKKKPKAAAPVTAPESVMHMAVNGHELSGEKRGGKWTFTCPSWPDLAEKWAGADEFSSILGDYMARALAGAITVRRLS